MFSKQISHGNFSALILIFLCLPQTSYAGYISSCGGSSTDPCACAERYECDQGECNCNFDDYCADTNCGETNSELINKDQDNSKSENSLPIETQKE